MINNAIIYTGDAVEKADALNFIALTLPRESMAVAAGRQWKNKI